MRTDLPAPNRLRRWSMAVLAASAFGCHSGSAADERATSTGASASSKKAAPAPDPAPVPDTDKPILVELFTSQGCSSCPPADRLLAEIESGAMGDDVVALAFHVDYWDYLGWKDPYSAAAWTNRQRAYARKLRKGSAYTPMLVVDGRAHVVGSRRQAVSKAIDGARGRKRAAAISATVERRDGGDLNVDAQLVPAAALPEPVSVIAFAVLGGARTRVRSGENSGRTLSERAIVLGMYPLADVDRGATAAAGGQVSIERDGSWPADVATVVIAQGQSGTIYDAVRLR